MRPRWMSDRHVSFKGETDVTASELELLNTHPAFLHTAYIRGPAKLHITSTMRVLGNDTYHIWFEGWFTEKYCSGELPGHGANNTHFDQQLPL